ncbi:MAG: polysaccharide biosynthesis C-terminal domain-containing protein, partial [Patescibacteria group bacterium]
LVRKIFSNTAWQIFGKVVTAALGIISIKLITNYLSRSTYGEYTTIYDYTALFAIVADFGLFTIAVREMAHNNKKEMVEKIVGNVLSLRTFLAVVSLGLGVVVAVILPAYHGSHIPYGVLIVSIATVITLIAGTMSSVLQFFLRMQWASISLIVGKIITVAYIVVTILYVFPNNPEAGFPHLLLAWIFGGLATIIITYVATSSLAHIRYQFDFSFWKTVLIKALPYGLALVLGSIYFRMGTITLSLLNMKDQVGYYGVPIRFLEILQIAPHYFMNSVLPILTMSLAISIERSARIIRYALSALFALALPLFAGGYLLAWPLTAAVSSPDFLTHRTATGVLIPGSDIALKILLAAMIFTYLHVAMSYALVAMGKQTELLWINAVAVAVNVIANFVLVSKFGFIGAAMSAVAAEITVCVLAAWRLRKRIRSIWDFAFIGKTFVATIMMSLVLWLTTDRLNALLFTKSLFILVPLGGTVFIFGMFLTRAVSKEMFQLLRKTEPAESSETLGL